MSHIITITSSPSMASDDDPEFESSCDGSCGPLWQACTHPECRVPDWESFSDEDRDRLLDGDLIRHGLTHGEHEGWLTVAQPGCALESQSAHDNLSIDLAEYRLPFMKGARFEADFRYEGDGDWIVDRLELLANGSPDNEGAQQHG